MPTKHKRRRDDEKANHDLPPTTKARSLPVIEPTKDFLAPRKKQKTENDKHDKKPKKTTDDTPKAFARLMAWHQQGKRIGGGLDNGEKPSKKQKKSKTPNAHQLKTADAQAAPTTAAQNVSSEAQPQAEKSSLPKIMPGESLAEFNIRVDQSLPLSEIAKQNKSAGAQLPDDLREKEKKAKHLTKHNKRLARMQGEWRNTEEKLRAREEEEAEENVEKIEEERLLWDGVRTTGKKGKKKVVEDDPWKELEKKRRTAEGRKKGVSIGLSVKDQVQAPPEINVKKLNPFKTRPAHTQPTSKIPDIRNVQGGKKVRRKDEMGDARKAHLEAARRRHSGIDGLSSGIMI